VQLMTVIATGVFAALFSGVYLHLARRHAIVDTPNERSSHVRPTPHGGGLALLLAFFGGVVISASTQVVWPLELLALAAGAFVLMLLGMFDDLRGLSVGARFSVYALVCLLFALIVQRGALGQGPIIAATLALAAGVGLLWLLNLFNFMDGIDGIASLQTVIACTGAAILAQSAGGADVYVLMCLLLGAAHAGFLVWNWPPARLFMGDAGSVPTGFLVGGLALTGAVEGHLPIACWLILLACFMVDATWTLCWRIITRQPFMRAHRLHAYQRLSRHWGSHRAVDGLLLLICAIWLAPLAWCVVRWPQNGLFLVILAYLPLISSMVNVRRMT